MDSSLRWNDENWFVEMSRRTNLRNARHEARERWPELQKFLSATLHGDDDRSVDDDVTEHMHTMPLELRQQLSREWWHWNATAAAVDDIRFAIEALDLNLQFLDPTHARRFMNNVYDQLIVSIRSETNKDWRP